MHPNKKEFIRLIELTGWSQSEAARMLHKTPSAVNHMMNPKHPNKPSQTTLALLRFVIERERPNLRKKGDPITEQPSRREWKIIEDFLRLTLKDQAVIHSQIESMLRDYRFKWLKRQWVN